MKLSRNYDEIIMNLSSACSALFWATTRKIVPIGSPHFVGLECASLRVGWVVDVWLVDDCFVRVPPFFPVHSHSLSCLLAPHTHTHTHFFHQCATSQEKKSITGPDAYWEWSVLPLTKSVLDLLSW